MAEQTSQMNFTKWLRSEASIAFAIGAVVVSGINYFTSPVHKLDIQMAVMQNQIAEIKSNDLVHIELELTRANGTIESQQKQITDINDKLTELIILAKQKR